MKLKIAHFISSIDISTGGPARSVTHLVEKILEKTKLNISLFTSKSNQPIINSFKGDNGKIIFIEKRKLGQFIIQKNNLNNIDLFHGHGLWQLPVHQMSSIAIKNKKPYIITPRGMLEPWSLSQSKYKKKLALFFFQKKDLQNASCIHATAPMEVESIRALGFKNPVAMIPNGINISEFPLHMPEKSKKPRKILFLSRIHVKKGIENLINAWKLLNSSFKESWVVEIVGNGDENYIQSLKELIIKEGLSSEILIKSPVFGVEKIKLFREASLFVLPTFSENFGIVIAESLASYTPVITTKGTPWEDLEKNNCGWWIGVGVEPLKKALEQAIGSSDKTLMKMGVNGRKLIEDKYSMASVAQQMLQLYQWILTKDNKPNFVDIL